VSANAVIGGDAIRSLQSTTLAVRSSGASSGVAPTLIPVTGFPMGGGSSRQGGSGDPTCAATVSNSGDAGLAPARLEEEAWYYLRMAVAPSTACSYSSAQRRYHMFCVCFSLPPLPATEQVLILFVAKLGQSVCHATIPLSDEKPSYHRGLPGPNDRFY